MRMKILSGGDGCCHYISSSGPRSNFNRGVFNGLPIRNNCGGKIGQSSGFKHR